MYQDDRTVMSNEGILGIEFHKSPVLGVSPVFNVKLFRDKISKFEGIRYTKIEGSYEAEIPFERFQKLCEIINLDEFRKLEPKYISDTTCGGVEVIKLHLDSGLILTVEDYGNAGPGLLKRIKEQLTSQMYKVRWECSAKR